MRASSLRRASDAARTFGLSGTSTSVEGDPAMCSNAAPPPDDTDAV